MAWHSCGGDDCAKTAIGDGVMALARVIGPVGSDAGDRLIGRDLVEQLRQQGRIPNVAAGDLNRPDLQRFLINPKVDLAPHAAFGTGMLARVPLTLAHDPDASAFDQKM